MEFINLQYHVWKLISAAAAFSANAATTVFEDIGFSDPAVAAALDLSTAPAGAGYAIKVWPPARGRSGQEVGGQVGTENTIVVRIEVNPQLLKTMKTPARWLNSLCNALVVAIVQDGPELGGVRFTLAPDGYELINFDEGLIAYHFRFEKFAVFGTLPDTADGEWTTDSYKLADSI